MREALHAELRAVGHDDHFVGRVHHGSFSFDEQQVVVEEPAVVDARHAEDRAANVQSGEHLVGVPGRARRRSGDRYPPTRTTSWLAFEANKLATGSRIGNDLQPTT